MFINGYIWRDSLLVSWSVSLFLYVSMEFLLRRLTLTLWKQQKNVTQTYLRNIKEDMILI